MAPIAARKCREIVNNTEKVIAIELLCGAQALDLFTNLKPGEGTRAAYEVIRKAVSHLEQDRILAPDIETMVRLIRGGGLLARVERVTGALH
jgi:histidine ammonia-lyase